MVPYNDYITIVPYNDYITEVPYSDYIIIVPYNYQIMQMFSLRPTDRHIVDFFFST